MQIQLASFEFVTEVSGTVGSFHGLNHIKFVSNLQKTYGPFGQSNRTAFTVLVQPGSGLYSWHLRALWTGTSMQSASSSPQLSCFAIMLVGSTHVMIKSTNV
jgi:hypothetical protein